MDDKAPVFVKLKDYKDITDIMELTREKIHQAKVLMERIAELKAQEDRELEAWASELTEVEHKIEEIDRALLKPNHE